MNLSTLPATSPLRIALVTETWPPEINGVAMSVFQLAQGLKARGHSILLIRPHQAKLLTETPADHEVCVRGFAIPKYPDLQFGAPAYGAIKRALTEFKADIVHIVTEGPLGLAALYAARALKLAVSSGFHSSFHEFSRFFNLKILMWPVQAFLRFFHDRTDVTCVPSNDTRNHLLAWGVRCPLSLVSRGVNTERFHPSRRHRGLRAEWGVNDDTTVVISVSRLSPEKNLALVIAAYRRLQKQQPKRQFKLVLVGDGPDRARLERLAPDAVFAGMQTGIALAEYYASGDVFFFASEVETFGNVVLEAMASGLPIVAYDYACAGQMVTTEQGFLSPLSDSERFQQLCADLPNKDVLQRMGHASANKAASMSWFTAVLELENALFLALSRADARYQRHSRLPLKTLGTVNS